MSREPYTCGTCKYWEDNHWVCCCAYSDHCADFTEPEDSCPFYAPREEDYGQQEQKDCVSDI